MRRLDGKKARPLTPEHAQEVARKIGSWPTTQRLTWDDVVDLAAVGRGKDRYVWGRQALDRNPTIKAAYERKTQEIRDAAAGRPVRRPKTPTVEALETRIAELQARLQEQAEDLARYDRMFMTWLKNAADNGMTEAMLNASVDPPPRDQTNKDELAAARAKRERRNERAR